MSSPATKARSDRGASDNDTTRDGDSSRPARANPFVAWLTEGVSNADRFFFAPRSTRLLGALRWASGLMLVYTHLVWSLALPAFLTDEGWLPKANVEAFHGSPAAWSFWFLVPDAWVWPVHVLAVLLLAVYTIGLFTRLTSWLAVAIVVSYANRLPTALFGLDQINAMLTLYVAVGYLAVPRASRAFSLDRRLATSGAEPGPIRPTWSANLGIRLIQLHMCVIYTFAGFGKLLGASWWDGSAMWRTVSNLEYQTIDLTWIAHAPWLSDVLTHATAFWELTFWALVWRPYLRWPVLGMAVLVHLGIGAAMGMMTFGLIMLVGCAAFLPVDEPLPSA